jgi:hypothetical protein
MAQCFWCPNREKWTGKDREGVRIYVCDEHKGKVASDLYRLESGRCRRPVPTADESDAALTGDLY